MSTSERSLYLSFDDGPHPVVTTKVLDMLHAYQAKATFFCLGKNVEAYPDVYQRMLMEGHAVGNHSYDHVHGFRTSNRDYEANIIKAKACIDSTLFRPPYGRMKRSQEKRIISLGMRPVMWTVLSGDYEEVLSKENCARRVLKNMAPGNIFLFHDSEKAAPRMLFALERVLQEGSRAGFQFNII